MEQFNRNNPHAAQHAAQSSRSSLYSTDSAGNRISYVENRASSETTRTTSSRPVSLAPSYMSAALPRRKPAPIMTGGLPSNRIQTSEPSSAQVRSPMRPPTYGSRGLLLLIVAAEPAAKTISHIQVLFKRHAFSGIIIIGNNEYEAKLKDLRIEIYALIGRMGMELGVQTYLRGSWSEEETAAVLQDSVGKVGEKIRSVLCIPRPENLGAGDILNFDEAQTTTMWRQSFGFIHTIARTTFPLILQDGNPKKLLSSFFITQTIDQGAGTMVMRSACGMLLKQLGDTYRPRGLAVGYAEDILIPEPDSVEDTLNGHATPKSSSFGGSDHQPAYTPGESPTKLWGMWALQEQLGNDA